MILPVAALSCRSGGSGGSGVESVVDAVPADASADPDGSRGADGAIEEPAQQITHWQVNIEWTAEDKGEDEFHDRATEKSHLPDIIAAQELWPGADAAGLQYAGGTAFEAIAQCRQADGTDPGKQVAQAGYVDTGPQQPGGRAAHQPHRKG